MARFWMVVVAAVLASAAEARQDSTEVPDAALITALERLIPQVMAASGTPGVNLALARRGKVVWERGFGYADLHERTPMTPATVFHSGSMGKTYTATAVMQMVEQDALGLDEAITDLDGRSRDPKPVRASERSRSSTS